MIVKYSLQKNLSVTEELLSEMVRTSRHTSVVLIFKSLFHYGCLTIKKSFKPLQSLIIRDKGTCSNILCPQTTNTHVHIWHALVWLGR